MALTRIGSQALDLISCLSAPQAASLITGSSDDLVALRVKLDFTDFVLVTL